MQNHLGLDPQKRKILEGTWLTDILAPTEVKTPLLEAYFREWGENKNIAAIDCGIRLEMHSSGNLRAFYIVLEHPLIKNNYRISRIPITGFPITLGLFMKWYLNPDQKQAISDALSAGGLKY